jgi:hypothetical protein
MAMDTKKGNCQCTRQDVTLYKTERGWLCGQCMRKLPKRRGGR